MIEDLRTGDLVDERGHVFRLEVGRAIVAGQFRVEEVEVVGQEAARVDDKRRAGGRQPPPAGSPTKNSGIARASDSGLGIGGRNGPLFAPPISLKL